MTPLVSVVILAYNKAPYIADCLDHILDQKTNFPIEILIGEDDSTDGTRSICQEYASKYPDTIQLFLRRQSDKKEVLGKKSMHWNFVETMNAAKGKYIAYCDGDDFWIDPNKLQKQYDFLEAHPDYAICTHNCQVVDAKGHFLTPFSNNPETTFTFETSLNHRTGPASSMFLCRKVVDEFNLWTYINKVVFQDWPLELLTLSQGKGYYDSEMLGVYRTLPSSASSHGNGLLHIDMRINVLLELLHRKSIPQKKEVIIQALEHWYLRRANHLAKRGALRAALFSFMRSLLYLRVFREQKWKAPYSKMRLYTEFLGKGLIKGLVRPIRLK